MVEVVNVVNLIVIKLLEVVQIFVLHMAMEQIKKKSSDMHT